MARTDKVGTTATSIYTEDGLTVIRYHSAKVVQFDGDRIILNSGGWLTNTTKARMNQASNQYGLGFNVYQYNGEWFVTYKGQTTGFSDGITLYRKG